MLIPEPQDIHDSFDFRSARFSADALALHLETGCSMQQCRQELFIAEGVRALALEALHARHTLYQRVRRLH